jgi:hypothetical protein
MCDFIGGRGQSWPRGAERWGVEKRGHVGDGKGDNEMNTGIIAL